MQSHFEKYWEIIADNLSKAGWSWGCVSAVEPNGRTIFVADAHLGEKVARAHSSLLVNGCRLRFGNEFLKIWIVAQRVRPERGKRAAELPGKANALHQILKSPIRTDGFELW